MRGFQENRGLFVCVGIMLLGMVALYLDHLPALEKRWSAEDNSYCWLVPPVFAYLVWEARGRFALRGCGSPWPGFLLTLVAGAVYLVGLLGSLETLVYGSMWLALMAGAAVLFGAMVLRPLAFPFLVLAFAVPLPPFIIRLLTFRLKLLSSEWAVRMLEWLSIPAYGEGNVIDMGVTRLQIIDACSGLRYLLPSVLLALLIGHFFHKRWWEKVLLVVFSVPVTLVSNAFRIAMTGVLVTYVSPEFGEGFLHDFSGWLVYMLAILLLGGLSFGLRRFLPAPEKGDAEKEPGLSTTACEALRRRWPSAVVFSALLVLFAMGGEHLFARQVVPARHDFSHFAMQQPEWRGKRLYLSKDVLDQLWADDYVTGSYKNLETGNSLNMLVSYYAKQTTVHTAHAPTSCLVGSGWSLDHKEVLPPSPETGRDFPVARMVLTQGRTRVVSNFWFLQRGRHIVDEYANKLWLVWDSFTMGRSDGALVRLELFLNEGQSLEDGQALLDGFAGELQHRLEAHVPGREALPAPLE